ncbi:MAG TPA: hypothetical protein PLP99_01010 [Ignavibacteriales bacterium]|nr:hypothetical protein [Ignavibacteriales bacterium]HOL80326.1 hypothetical protein [Ignavibacteriales bacterium]HOM64605.1 hypothetical protein [Ignavibacteriales bacterium]HPP32515.1 hypothetical protein [Ignavibacteriales bacterium]HRR17518.1 hypothetical protein [Ignavibacteriales bacterium]
MKQEILGQIHRLFDYKNNSFTPIILTGKINNEIPFNITKITAETLAELKAKILYVDLNSTYTNNSQDLSLFFDNKLLLDETIIENDSFFHTIILHKNYFSKIFDFDNLNYFTENLKKISSYYDLILINYNSIIDEYLLYLATISNYILFSITPSVKDIMDAYSAIKMFQNNNLELNYLIQIYNSEDDEDANIAFLNLNKATLHFLNIELIFAGNLNKGFDYNYKL